MPNPNARTKSRAFLAAEAGRLDQELPFPPRSVDDLPAPNTKRWVTRRKAQVVAGVKIGLLSVADACARYHLTEEEFCSWQSLIETHGLRGLRVTQLQQYRRGSDNDSVPLSTRRVAEA